MKNAAYLVLSCFLGFLAAPQASAKDLILEQKTTVAGVGERAGESTQYWTPAMMIVDEPGVRVIVDFATEKLTQIDKTNKNYLTLTFDQMLAQMDASREDLAKRTGDYPPEAKKALEGMGEDIGDKNSPVDVKPTGKHDKIAGYDTDEYTFSGNAGTGTFWVSKALPLPLGPKELKAFRKSMDGMKGPGRLFALAMTQVNGIPLRTELKVNLGPQGTTTTNEVVAVREASPPAEMITVPEGYNLIKVPDAPAAK